MAVFIEKEIIWFRQPCVINGEMISTTGGPKTEYDVMEYNGKGDKPALYAIFAAIDENNIEEIKDFCSQFGLLGLSRNKAYIENYQNQERELAKEMFERMFMSQSISDTTINPPYDYFNLISRQAEYTVRQWYQAKNERIYNVQCEIKTMRTILQAINAIRKRDEKSVRIIWRELFLLNASIDYETSAVELVDILESRYFENNNPVDPFYLLGNITSVIINRQLAGVTPGLDPTFKTGNFKPEWRSSNLLAGMYLMVYTELIQGHLFKQCENETCHRWFPVNASKIEKKYCDNDCARLQAQRKYRRKQKNL